MRRISSKASWIFSVFLLLAGAGAAQAYNLTPFQDICMEAYVTLDGDLDDITYDADERMVEIAADNRIRIGRNDCYRNTPAFEDGTVYL